MWRWLVIIIVVTDGLESEASRARAPGTVPLMGNGTSFLGSLIVVMGSRLVIIIIVSSSVSLRHRVVESRALGLKQGHQGHRELGTTDHSPKSKKPKLCSNGLSLR